MVLFNQNRSGRAAKIGYDRFKIGDSFYRQTLEEFSRPTGASGIFPLDYGSDTEA
jgi:hypothetical protein